jgi:oligopeptide/dipeptide ABC transporter ATP-binding protein
VSLLEVDGLKTDIRLRTATVHAVDGVTFSVEHGETVGVVGESGCGKTMMGLSVMRLLPHGGIITGGQIRFDGRDLVTLDPKSMRKVRGEEIGMVFQDPMTSLNPTMTIGNQIGESVRLHRGVSKRAALERAMDVLALVGMPRPRERVNDFPHQLSGGLRQRVMIAMALACEPQLLIADEPTTALDVTIQAQILSLLDDLKAKLGMAMILITHDMGVIAGRSDRVMVMYAGRIVESAETDQLFGRMRHPYTEALLASIPQLDQDASQRLYSIPGLPPDLTNPPSGCRFAARCLYATDICRNEDPQLAGPDPHHPFACWHPRDISVDEVAGAGEVIARAVKTAANREVADTAEKLFAGVELARLADLGGNGSADGEPEMILDFHHVTKDFAVTAGAVLQRRIGTLQAVTDFSLSIRRGETFGVVGESGCGKTTLGRMAVGLESPTSGDIIFNGTKLTSLKRRQLRTTRRDLQLMFQDPYASLDPRMRVGSIVREPLAVQRIGSRREQQARVRELLGEVGLPGRSVERYPHEFSGGQRQRIGLARALTLNPKVIVADEPVSALDVSIRSQILNLMKGLQEAHGLTYIVISHDLSVVHYLADRIGVMYLGRLIEVGTGDDIYERAAHPYTRGLLDTIPVPNPAVERQKKGSAIKGELPSPLHPPSGCRFRTRCPRAQQRCADEVPNLTSFGGEHFAACFFPLQQPVELTAKAASA